MSSLLTIVTAATAANRRLCTLAAVKTELSVSGTSLDAQLDGYRDDASAMIATWCGRTFAEEVVSETFRLGLRQDSPLVLARVPITALASVTEDGTAVAEADRELHAEAGLLWRLSSDRRSTWGPAKVVLQYTAGWRVPDQTTPTLPADVQRAAALLAAALYLSKGRDRAIRSESVDGVAAASYLDPRSGHEQLPPEVAGMLKPYRRLHA